VADCFLTALCNGSLQQTGRVYAVTGPNGCGKSTAFAVISSCLAVLGEAGGAGAEEGAGDEDGAARTHNNF
jgi:ABC-type multidrug transport system ATPase subunit